MNNEITQADLDQYAECQRLISVGAYTERGGDEEYPEDGVEEFVDTLKHKAATLGFKLVYHERQVPGDLKYWYLEPMTTEEKAEFAAAQEEQRAVNACEAWAKFYFADEDGAKPEVEVVGTRHINDVWIMELQGTGEEVNPMVTFRLTEGSNPVDLVRIEIGTETRFFEYAEAVCRHQERKTQDWTEYYVLLHNAGGETVSVILKHHAALNTVMADPYKPADWDYTIHDGCDHDGSKEGHGEYCVLDDPESDEFQEVEMANKYVPAVNALEKQVKQSRIADELSIDKAKQEGK